MHRSPTQDQERWLRCLVRMAAAGAEAVEPLQGTPAGRSLLGQGAGGDRTLEVDRACEDSILAVLAREAPASYSLVSEETGITEVAGAPWRVVLDPLDGSLNAKRGLEPFCASIALAAGDTLRDVEVAHIRDYLRPHAFSAVRGGGLLRADPDDPIIAEDLDGSRLASDLVEVMLLEAVAPTATTSVTTI